jgi:hypothetical protein
MGVAQQDNAVTTARAFATYALVPYLGILFCPGALVMGSVGVVNSYRSRGTARRSASYSTMVVATIELAAQLTLWWILYKVPEWSQGL